MKKQKTIVGSCLSGIFLVFFLLQACIKLSPNFDPRDGNNVFNGCRIKEITSYSGNPPVAGYHRTFEYNSNNDPLKVISGPFQGMGYPDLSFKYDNKKRLIEFSGIFHVVTEMDFQFVHRYGYTQNRITTDTVYELGFFNAKGDPVNYINKFLKYLKYDNLNRIIQDSTMLLYPVFDVPVSVANIHYDIDGNRIIAEPKLDNGKAYDDKLNLHRTNKVWMFIDREYSVNNPVGASTYNNTGLPLTFAAREEGSSRLVMGFAGFGYIDSTAVSYDCR